MKFYRLPVRGGPRGSIPIVNAANQICTGDDILFGDDFFQGCQPPHVVVFSFIPFFSFARIGYFFGQCVCPFLPCKQTATMKLQGHGEGLRFPRLIEYGAVLVTRQCGNGVKIHVRQARGSHPKDPDKCCQSARRHRPIFRWRQTGRCTGAGAFYPASLRWYRQR